MLHSRFERKPIFIMAALFAASAVFAVALLPATSGEIRPLLQPLAIVTCATPGPCQTYSNTGTGTKSGAGLEGISTGGKGLIGQTKFNSTSTSNGQAGVQGQDISTSGKFDAGVQGTSTRGIGVAGQSTSNDGVYGASSSYVGVYGKSTGYLGVFGTGPTYGVAGSSVNGAGVYGSSTNGVGVLGLSSNFVGVNAIGGFLPPVGGDFPALSIVGNTAGGGSNDLIDACQPGTANPCDSASSVFRVDGVGNVTAKSFGPLAASATSARQFLTYAAQSSQPTIEDYGEAQLVGGQAYVHLDPAFANVINQHARYLVVVTPEGDSNGLYVTQKTLSGFVVRENRGGKSSLAFTYRVETRPFGATEARLPLIDEPLRGRHMTARPWHPGTLVPVH
jgi:hypothetical protein